MTTLYEIVKEVAFLTLGIRPNLALGDPKTGALVGDISKLVAEEAERRYPDQLFEKVDLVLNGKKYKVRAYPEYMVQDFVSDVVAGFLKTHRAFDGAGSVVYDRHIPTAAERQARTEAKLTEKYGQYVPHFSSRQTTPASQTTQKPQVSQTTQKPQVSQTTQKPQASQAAVASQARGQQTQTTPGKITYRIVRKGVV